MIRAFALALVAAALAACGTAPKVPPAKPGYYAKDGPPETVPPGIANVADAVPRDEPYHRYANRPYTVFGRSYAPVVNDDPMKERGIATWYGRMFHGRKTASGEVYDMFAMTAAHKTLPIPSFARVTDLASGNAVVVRVNDRGPFHEGRVIDLSYAAAVKLGIAGRGSGQVEVERVFAREAGTQLAAATPPPARPSAPVPGSVATPLGVQDMPQPRTAQVETSLLTPERAGIYVQLGAFASPDNAESFRDHLARELPWILEPIQVTTSAGLQRVRLGPYKTREAAQAIADKIQSSLDFAPVLTPATR